MPRGTLFSGTNAAVLKYARPCPSGSNDRAGSSAVIPGTSNAYATVRLQDAVLGHVGPHREDERAARLDAMQAGERPAVQHGGNRPVAERRAAGSRPRTLRRRAPIEERRAPQRLEVEGLGMLLIRPVVFSG